MVPHVCHSFRLFFEAWSVEAVESVEVWLPKLDDCCMLPVDLVVLQAW